MHCRVEVIKGTLDELSAASGLIPKEGTSRVRRGFMHNHASGYWEDCRNEASGEEDLSGDCNKHTLLQGHSKRY